MKKVNRPYKTILTHEGLPGSASTWTFMESNLSHIELGHVVGFLSAIESSLTRETYLYGLKRFIATGGGPLLKTTCDSLRKWALGIKANRTTVKSTLTALRSFYNYVVGQNPGFKHPFAGFTLRLPGVRDGESLAVSQKVLSLEQIRLVISKLDAEEVRTSREIPGAFLFKFLAMGGFRISEALSLNFHDPARDGTPGYVNFLKPMGDGRFVVRVLGKAHRLRDVQLSEELSQVITRRFPAGVGRPGAPVFTTHDNRNCRLGRHGAYSEAKNIGARFMQDFPGGMSRRFAWHCLRHSLATHLLVTVGEDPLMVARALGHSPGVLARYYLHGTRDVLKGLKLLT